MKRRHALIGGALAAAVALVAAHLFAFGLAATRLAAPAVAIVIVLLAAVLAHLGVMARLTALIRRRPPAD
ncbi:MAG TPA: hypothetical protein VN694_10220 [Caulobacteraceae bacterium]|nr:hypothetical protein [Caulobacteraceae bacterium]